MPTNKKPRKQYRPGLTAHNTPLRSQPVKLHLVFQPIFDILNSIEQTGDCDFVGSDTPVFKVVGQSEYYGLEGALNGFIDLFQMWGKRTAQTIDTSALSRLLNCLKAGSPLQQSHLDAARQCLHYLREVAGAMPAGVAAELVEQTLVKVSA